LFVEKAKSINYQNLWTLSVLCALENGEHNKLGGDRQYGQNTGKMQTASVNVTQY